MLSVEDARRDYEDLAREAAFYALGCARDGALATCFDCGLNYLEVEAASIALDMAVALAISGPGPRPATRLAAHDLAIREGIAWS